MVKTKQQGLLSTIREFVGLLLIVFLIRTFGFGLYQVPTGSMETTMLVGERFFADKLTPLFTSFKHGTIVAFNDPVYSYSVNFVVRLFQQYVWGPSNWTKRVIGIPGDHVRGVVENGKPVIYLNGKKLNEPHLNKYPLIMVAKENPLVLRQKIRAQFRMRGIDVDRPDLKEHIERIVRSQTTLRSYDPKKPYEQQFFYDIKEDMIFRGQDGKPVLIYPNTLLRPVAEGSTTPENENFWNGSDQFNVKLGKNQYWLMGDNRLGSGDCRLFGPVSGSLIHGRILFRIWSSDSSESWWIFDLIKHPIGFWKRMRWSRFFQMVR